MSAPNFKTMRDFPLYVTDTPYCKVCPECGCVTDADGETCPDCGCDLKDVAAVYDDVTDDDNAREMKRVADEINAAQDFYNVSVESGYYTGIQFYVEDKYDNLEEWDNDDAKDEFGVCRSEMLRRYAVAANKVRKMLKAAANELFLTELACMGVFSNGEAVYRKVERKVA